MICQQYITVCVSLDAINKAAEAWGVDCKRYEIRKSSELNWALSLNFKTKLFIYWWDQWNL